MKHLHRMALHGLPGPFFGWLGLLLFLLLMQFLIKYLPDIAGRNLPLGLVLELIAYNLAYMFVLAVPMSALLSALMAFGSLAESRAYLVVKTSGVSALAITWPALLVGCALTLVMVYFNNVLLPESNFRARNIWEDVHSKRPGFDLQPGVFYDGLDDYAILVKHRNGNALRDILIYDHTRGRRTGTTITAQSGTLISQGVKAKLHLQTGEVHRFLPNTSSDMYERYERFRFDRLHLSLDLSAFNFERTGLTDGHRSDRSTRTLVMMLVVDSLRARIDTNRAMIRNAYPMVARTTSAPQRFQDDSMRVSAFAGESARMASDEVGRLMRTIARQERWMNRYRVEIHKKFSIATACLIFMLLGAPLGLSIRRGGLGISAIVALGVFLLYWSTLVQGEKLADRGFLSPWISMWIANVVVGLGALGLFAYVSLDLRALPRLRALRRLRARLSRKLR